MNDELKEFMFMHEMRIMHVLDHLQIKLNLIDYKLDAIIKKEEAMSKEMDVLNEKIAILTEDVTAENNVIDSAVALLNGLTTAMADLSQQLADAIAAGDSAAIQAAADAIVAQNQIVTDKTAALAAAVQANTPAPTP